MSQDHKIVVKFGSEILQEGFTPIPNIVLRYYRKLGISFNEMMTIIHIWEYWWTKELPYPSLDRIANVMGITRRSVRFAIASLEKKMFVTEEGEKLPLLVVYDRYGENGTQISNEYDFTNLIKAALYLYNKDPEVIKNDIKSDVTRKPRKLRGEDNFTLEDETNFTLPDEKSFTPRDDVDFTGEDDVNNTPGMSSISPGGGYKHHTNNTKNNNTSFNNTDRYKEREISDNSFKPVDIIGTITIPEPSDLIKAWAAEWNIPESAVKHCLLAVDEQINDKGVIIDDLKSYIRAAVTKHLQNQSVLDYLRRPKK